VSNGHIAQEIAKAEHINEVIHADSILSQMQKVKDETWIIHRESREQKRKLKDGTEISDPDNELALKAIARLEKQIEIESKVLGVVKNPDIPIVSTMTITPESLKKIGDILAKQEK